PGSGAASRCGGVARGLLARAPRHRALRLASSRRAGEHVGLVRASYAMGTGPRLPDIEGFALRVLPRGPGLPAGKSYNYRWGVSGLNRRPTDYESVALTD